MTTEISRLSLGCPNRFVQFQLWRNCNVNCDFCYNKGLGNTDKLWAVKAVYEKMLEPVMTRFNEYGLIGGEIFGKELNDPEVRVGFYKIINLIIERIKLNIIDKVYITTSLIYKDRQSLVEFCEYLKYHDVESKFLICTSYDTIYRFKNENSEKLWSDNMDFLRKNYPKLPVHVESILTQDFIEKVLLNQFDIKAFEARYKTKLNFIEPQCNSNCLTKEEFDKQLPRFLPKRNDFLKFLAKCTKDKSIDIFEFLNEALHSDLLYMECNGYLYEFLGRRRFPTMMDAYYRKLGRNFYHLGYVDSDIKVEDDVKAYRDLVGEL